MIKINEPQLPWLRTAIYMYHTGLDVKMEVTQLMPNKVGGHYMEFTKSGITIHVVYIVCSSRPTFKVVFIVVHTAPYIVSTERGGKDSKRRR